MRLEKFDGTCSEILDLELARVFRLDICSFNFFNIKSGKNPGKCGKRWENEKFAGKPGTGTK